MKNLLNLHFFSKKVSALAACFCLLLLNASAQDTTPPVAACDQNTVVSIGSNGSSLVNAITFDDGSTDNVGIVLYEVRRMDNPNCSGNDG
ncbi:MAG: hypothetical protein AAF573_10005, partial [Bacteroidota bacterium]